MQFTSTIIVTLLLAVSTLTVTAAQTSPNLRGGRQLPQEQNLSGPAPSSSGVLLPVTEDAGTAVFPAPNRSLYGACPGLDYPAQPSDCPMCYNDQICCAKPQTDDQFITIYYCSDPVPSSLGVSLPAMGTAETAAPSSLGLSLPAMEDAGSASVPDPHRSLSGTCPIELLAQPGDCGNCYGDGDICCQKPPNQYHCPYVFYCIHNP